MAVVNPKWRTVQLPRGVIEQVEKYIKSEDYILYTALHPEFVA